MSGNLVGSFVTMHIMGGTQMTGEVIEQNSESIFLEIDSEVYMVFKSKVCYVKMEKEKNLRMLHRMAMLELRRTRSSLRIE